MRTRVLRTTQMRPLRTQDEHSEEYVRVRASHTRRKCVLSGRKKTIQKSMDPGVPTCPCAQV